MNRVLVLAAVLVATVTSSDWEDEEWIDYRVASRSRASVYSTPSPKCLKPGVICGDCKDVYVCRYEDGELVAEFATTCETPLTCNAGVCSDTPTPECSVGSAQPFVCKSLEGMYPDPASCKNFHYCVPPKNDGEYKEISSSCGTDYGYNPKSTYCDKKLTNDTCTTYPVPVCDKPGQTGALKDNPTLYYICLQYESQVGVLYPYLYLCEHGKTSDGNYGCK